MNGIDTPILVLSGPFAPALSPGFEAAVLVVLLGTLFLGRRRLATRRGLAGALLLVWLSAGGAALGDRRLSEAPPEQTAELPRTVLEQTRARSSSARGDGPGPHRPAPQSG